MRTLRRFLALAGTLLTLAIFLPPASAAKLRVAVLEFGNAHRDPRLGTPEAAQTLTRGFKHFLNSTQRFEVLAEAAPEASLPRDARLSDPRAAIAALQGRNLDYLVTGLLEGDASTTEATASFIPLTGPKSGYIAADVRAVGITTTQVSYLAKTLADQAVKAFPLQGCVLMSFDGGGFLADLGADDGLAVNDTLDVRQIANEYKDPASGEILYQDLRTVGRARVVGLDPGGRTCRCEMNTGDVRAQKGMLVASAAAEVASGPSVTLAVGEPIVSWPTRPHDETAYFAQGLPGCLSNGDRGFAVLNRPDLRFIRDEIELGQGADFDWDTTAKAGHLLGASVLAVPVIARRGADYVASARLDDVATGRVLVTATVCGPRLADLLDPLAEEITRCLQPLTPEEVGPGLPRAKLACDYDKGVIPLTQYPCLRRFDMGLVRWALENPGDEPQTLRITTDIPGYTAAPCTTEVCLKPHQRLSSLGQTPPLDPARITALAEETTPAQVKCVMELVQGGRARKLLDDSYEVRLLRPGIWVARLNAVDLVPTVALMARDSALLVQLRGRAATLSNRKSLPGYQLDAQGADGVADTPENRASLVRDQVAALYRAVAEFKRADGTRGLRYVDQSAIAFPPTGAQRVLTPDETLQGGGANCLDSSILFAALLAPVMQPILIITDTHAFVGWRTWSNPEAPYDVVETTCIGAASFEEAVARARTEADQARISALLEGKQGRLSYNPKGELVAPRDVLSLPGVQAILDVRTARTYFQSCF